VTGTSPTVAVTLGYDLPRNPGQLGVRGAILETLASAGASLRLVSALDHVPLDDDFQSAQTRVKQLAQTPPPDQLLELYSLYKQATEGDVQGEGCWRLRDAESSKPRAELRIGIAIGDIRAVTNQVERVRGRRLRLSRCDSADQREHRAAEHFDHRFCT